MENSHSHRQENPNLTRPHPTVPTQVPGAKTERIMPGTLSTLSIHKHPTSLDLCCDLILRVYEITKET